MGDSGDLIILIPVLRRPQNVAPVLASARETVPDARVLFIADRDDEVEIAALRGHDFITVSSGTNYAAKINAGFDASSEPLCFSGADDIRFRPGWFEEAKALLTDEVQVVGTVDRWNSRTERGRHSTHTLFTRRYVDESGTIDEPGKVLHEGYPHEYCDDEFVQTAMARCAYAHAFESVVEHLRPLIDTPDEDEVYKLGRSTTVRGRRLFARRRRLWQR